MIKMTFIAFLPFLIVVFQSRFCELFNVIILLQAYKKRQYILFTNILTFT